MRYVVTGGAGFVGSNLTKLLVKEGHDVTVIDNLVKGKKENLSQIIDKIEFVKGDIRNYDDMEEKFQNIDGIFLPCHHNFQKQKIRTMGWWI